VPLELVGCKAVQAAVWAHRVVVVPPGFNDHGSLLSGSEPLQRQALVAQLAVEAFVGAVLPMLTRVAQGDCYSNLRNPFEDGVTDELRSVVRSQLSGAPWMRTASALLSTQVVVQRATCTCSNMKTSCLLSLRISICLSAVAWSSHAQVSTSGYTRFQMEAYLSPLNFERRKQAMFDVFDDAGVHAQTTSKPPNSSLEVTGYGGDVKTV